MAIPNRPPQTKYSTQNIQNASYDDDFGVLVFENLEYDPTGQGSMVRSISRNLPLRLDYDINDNPIYIGKGKRNSASSDASWQIKKLTWSGGNLVSITLADGNAEFDNIWDDRASLSYT